MTQRVPPRDESNLEHERNARPEELRGLLKFASVVWNAVIEENGDVDEAVANLVADLKAKVKEPPPEAFMLARFQIKSVTSIVVLRPAEYPRELRREIDDIVKTKDPRLLGLGRVGRRRNRLPRALRSGQLGDSITDRATDRRCKNGLATLPRIPARPRDP